MYVLTHSIMLTIHAIIQIGLQIGLLAANGALAWVASGIWAGVYFLITALFTFLLSKRVLCFDYKIGLNLLSS